MMNSGSTNSKKSICIEAKTINVIIENPMTAKINANTLSHPIRYHRLLKKPNGSFDNWISSILARSDALFNHGGFVAILYKNISESYFGNLINAVPKIREKIAIVRKIPPMGGDILIPTKMFAGKIKNIRNIPRAINDLLYIFEIAWT